MSEVHQSRIPRRIAFFWSGNRLSFARYLTLLSFRRLNPDWPMQLYTLAMPAVIARPWKSRERQDFHAYDGPDYFHRVADLGNIEIIPWRPPRHVVDALKTPVHASDIFQWDFLTNIGGIYADMDILFTAPLDEWLWPAASGGDAWLSFYEDAITIGFLASAADGGPGSMFHREINRVAMRRIQADAYQSAGATSVLEVVNRCFEISGRREKANPHSRLMALKSVFRGGGDDVSRDPLFVNIGRNVVYPFVWNETRDIWHKRIERLPKRCVGIHWFGGDPTSQKFNDVMDEQNWRGWDNTFTFWAANMLDGQERHG